MTNAKHYILANSTYHWWGAWLSANVDKVVVCPQYGWIHPYPFPKNWLSI